MHGRPINTLRHVGLQSLVRTSMQAAKKKKSPPFTLWEDLHNNEDAVECASGCWPRASTNRWYAVTHVERRLATPPLVASSDYSRWSQTLVVFRKVAFEKKSEGHVEPNEASVHASEHERKVDGY